MQRKKIQISGWVQGVGFRYYTKREAHFYGIKGFVKNQYDGSVYIEAEGEEKAMTLFIKWCYQGPGNAKVENIIIEDNDSKGFKSFEIKY